MRGIARRDEMLVASAEPDEMVVDVAEEDVASRAGTGRPRRSNKMLGAKMARNFSL